MNIKYKVREGNALYKKYWKVIIVITLMMALVLPLIYGCMIIISDKPEVETQKVISNEVVKSNKTVRKTVKDIKTIINWDVPLEPDLKLYIYKVAKKYKLDPELILGVIKKESDFVIDNIGDGGDSLGLMQVQLKWHGDERMPKLGATDLLDPYDNILVGTDYLAECINKGGLEWGLMAFNGGESYANRLERKGIVSDYAKTVLKYTEEFKQQ